MSSADRLVAAVRLMVAGFIRDNPKKFRGEPGDIGKQGPAGRDGAPGKDGDVGPQGPEGKRGLTGETGPQGVPGERGETGPKGEKGDVGLKGEQGRPGIDGVDGKDGKTGLKGERGPKGEDGKRILQAVVGPPGPQGLRGPAGEAGASAWGGIGGTLSNQADLQSALNAKEASGTAAAAIVAHEAALDPHPQYATAAEAAAAAPVQSVAGRAGAVTLVKGDVGLGSVDNTSDAAKPVSTATQTALDGKQPLDSDLTTIAGLTATTDNFMVAAASAWASRTPAQAKTSLALVKADVGLGSVDNTSDASKPVSTATQTALDLKANLAGPTFTGTVGGITAAMVGAPSGSGTSSGSNTGDQTSIAGITGTTAQFNAALTDADFATGGGTATGANTGDNAVNTQYSGLAASKQDTLVSATNIKTINGSTVLGSGDLVVSGAQPDIPLTKLAPTASQTITAGYSAYFCGMYEIVTATSLEIGAGACMEIG